MIPIIWTKAATTDIERHYSFLEPIDPDTAKKAVQAILKAGESLKVISEKEATSHLIKIKSSKLVKKSS
jgi:ParE toxin of type II toxin-antitoxin system, parDE